MKINKDLQNALLICTHLSKHGRSRVEDIATKFNLSATFLQQIAHKLGKHGVLTVYRGPNGGFELTPNIRIIDVLNAMNKNGFKASGNNYSGQPDTSHSEYATVSNIFESMWTELTPLLEVKIDTLVNKPL